MKYSREVRDRAAVEGGDRSLELNFIDISCDVSAFIVNEEDISEDDREVVATPSPPTLLDFLCL